MGRDKDYILEDILKDSESLISEIEKIDEENGLLPEKVEETIKEDVKREEMQSLDFSTAIRANGYVEVYVSEDEMKATADFYPPSEGISDAGIEPGKPIEPEDVEKVLEKKGIVTGIDWNAISEAIFRCNTERTPVTGVTIARGKKPVDEIPPHFEIIEELLKSRKPIDTDSQRIDFKEISPFTLVNKGQVLARLVPKVPGAFGETVLGKAIPFKKASIPQLKPGKNVVVEADIAKAGCHGRFIYTDDSFWVSEVLEIKSDVDYHTGNIDFPGDVVIYGNVQDGFKVRAGGSIYCHKTLDASEVLCGGDLFVRLGIIGRKKGVVKVKGSVEAKFIENCYLEAGGNISIKTSILNSVVHSLKRVNLGEKGIIVGGKVFAQNGVEAAQLGTRVGPKTEIHCGIDFTIQQKLEWIRDKNIELAMKLNEIDRRIKDASTPSYIEKLKEVRKKLSQAIHKLNAASATMVNELDKNEEADVKVSASVYPGVYIEICHISYIVNRELKHCRFYLDKVKGKIAVEPLVV